MDSTETIVIAVVCSVLGGLCLIALYISIKRRCFRYQELPESDPSNKLWVGQNPTDAVEEEPDAIPFDLEVATERNRKYVRLSSNFCRSLTHERRVTQLLPFIGPRDSKFYCLVNDTLVDREEKQVNLNVLMTMINGLVGSASGDNVGNWPDFTTTKYQQRLKRLLCALIHPYVMPTYDVAFALDKRSVFFVRPWSNEGSLRDLIFEQRDPTKAFYEKYPQRPTPTVGQRIPNASAQGRRGSKALMYGRGLRIEQISRFGRQIIEGLKYFQSLALPYYHLHTGNVIICNGAARLTDYENAYFGFHNRLHKKMKKLPIDPTLSSFGFLLYEMATGFEVPTPRKGRVELNIGDPSLDVVVDILNKIFHTTDHTVTLDEIASHRLFQVGITLPTYPQDRPDRVAVESKMQKMLAPILHYYVEKLYGTGTPSSSIAIKVSSPSSGGGVSSVASSPGTPAGSLSRSSSYSSRAKSKKDKKKSKRKPRDNNDSDDDGNGNGNDSGEDDVDQKYQASKTAAMTHVAAGDDRKERLLPTAEELAIDVPSHVSPPPPPPQPVHDDEL